MFTMCANCGKARKVCTCGEFREFVATDYTKCWIHKTRFDSNGNCLKCKENRHEKEVLSRHKPQPHTESQMQSMQTTNSYSL